MNVMGRGRGGVGRGWRWDGKRKGRDGREGEEGGCDGKSRRHFSCACVSVENGTEGRERQCCARDHGEFENREVGASRAGVTTG